MHRTEQLFDGVAIGLPPRRLPRAGCLTPFLVLFGLGFAAGPAIALASTDLFSALFSIPFVLGGLFLVVLGFAASFGRSDVRVEHGELRATERAWPLSWTRRRTVDGVTSLRVVRMPSGDGSMAGIGCLVVEYESGRPFYVALLYPTETLQSVAVDLAPHLGVDLGGELPEVVGDEKIEREPVSLDQPPGSAATLERNEVGLLLTLPPAGLMKGSKGIFLFAVIWCLLTFVMVCLLAFAQAGGGLLMMIPFFCIGVGLILGAVNMGRRHALIAIVRDSLLLKRMNLFGTKTHEWPRESIESIAVEPSSVTVNDSPVLQLAIRADGKRLGLWTGRDEAELRWIAAVLNDGLKLDESG